MNVRSGLAVRMAMLLRPRAMRTKSLSALPPFHAFVTGDAKPFLRVINFPSICIALKQIAAYGASCRPAPRNQSDDCKGDKNKSANRREPWVGSTEPTQADRDE